MVEQTVTESPKPIYEKITPWKDSIETATKAFVVVVGLAYVVGLFVLNMHIKNYGLHYLGFLQIEYVMAGALWLFLTAVMYFWFLVIKTGIVSSLNVLKPAQFVGHGWWRKIVGGVVFILFLVTWIPIISVFPLLIIMIISDGMVDAKSREMVQVFTSLVSGLIGIFNLYYLQFAIFKIPVYAHPILESKYYYLLQAFLFTVLLLSGISGYSTKVYPKLSPVFGGGRAQKANFVIKKDSVDTINVIGLSTDTGIRLIGPFEVIFESSDSYLLAPPENFGKDKNIKAIRLDKNLIEAVFYLKEK
jgi:hypothetical protein